MTRLFFILILILLLSACEKIALMTTPPKCAKPSHSQLANNAQNDFWHSLHTGNYAQIPKTENLLTAAYLQNPSDPQLASHLGFLHIWKITERQRLKQIPPTIVNEIILAKKYFKDAVQLNPGDARIVGFLGDSELISGQLFNDQREQVRGYFRLKKAIHMWPEFNYFTAGYPMSLLPPTSDQFKEALNWQWKTLDLCSGTYINRNNPDFSPYIYRETQQGKQRACWNSWIAPHNFEGFFLNMGDMLVKSGDTQTAVNIYKNARLSKTYDSWPYRDLLEARIRDAQKNTAIFRQNKKLMFNSGYGCVACHQSK